MTVSVLRYNNKIIAQNRDILSSRYTEPGWYGIEYDITSSSPDVTRIASNMTLHRTLPVHNQMKACLLLDNGSINYYLNPNDWSKKINGTASNLDGTDGMVMIEIPEFYILFELIGNIYRCKISEYPFEGFTKISKQYIGAYEASLQRSTLKLSSVVNTTTDYRGGNNNAAYDSQPNSFLGKAATYLSRTSYRQYARNRASGNSWNIITYEQHKIITWLFVVEYATRYSQKAVDYTLTSEGYRQGGLGSSVTNVVDSEWNSFNSRYPFINCGSTNSLASNSGEVLTTVNGFGGSSRSFNVNRYRGIEMVYGHVWKYLDGINIDIRTRSQGNYSKLYTTNTPSYFNDYNYINYTEKGLISRSDGYVKSMLNTTTGDIFPGPLKVGANGTTFWTNHFSTTISASSLRAPVIGGYSTSLDYAGFVCISTALTPFRTEGRFGSRLSYIPS